MSEARKMYLRMTAQSTPEITSPRLGNDESRDRYLKMTSRSDQEQPMSRPGHEESRDRYFKMTSRSETEQASPGAHPESRQLYLKMTARSEDELPIRRRHHDSRQFSDSENPFSPPRHHDSRQFSQSIDPAPRPRHYDARGHMHTPFGDLNAPLEERNPFKIGTTAFEMGAARKRRLLPTAPIPKEVTQKVLATDSTNFGFGVAPARMQLMAPQEMNKPDASFITGLRTETGLLSPRSNMTWSVGSSTPSSPRKSPAPVNSDVFDRLSNPKNFVGIHRRRFSDSGVGLGLLGSRDDTTMNQLIAGNGMILRDLDPKVESPNKVVLPDEAAKMAAQQKQRELMATFNINDAHDEEVMKTGVFARLSKESPNKKRDSGDYEAGQSTRRRWGVNKDQVLPFQVEAK